MRRLASLAFLLAAAAAQAAPPQVVFLDLGNVLIVKGRRWAPGARRALARLREHGVRLGVISNTGPLRREALVRGHLPPDFPLAAFDPELVLLSSEVGWSKPSPILFRLARLRAQVPAATLLFLDESPGHVAAARACGLPARQVRVEVDEAGISVASDLVALVEAALGDGEGAEP